jgi:hypothetical protein
MEKEE